VFVGLFLVSVCCEGPEVWGLKCAGYLICWCGLLRCVCFVCLLCVFDGLVVFVCDDFCVGCVFPICLFFDVLLLFVVLFFCCVECLWDSCTCCEMCVFACDAQS